MTYVAYSLATRWFCYSTILIIVYYMHEKGWFIIIITPILFLTNILNNKLLSWVSSCSYFYLLIRNVLFFDNQFEYYQIIDNYMYFLPYGLCAPRDNFIFKGEFTALFYQCTSHYFIYISFLMIGMIADSTLLLLFW